MKKIIIGLVVLIIIAGILFKGKGLMETRKDEIINEPLPKKISLSVSITKAKQGMMKETQAYLALVASDKSINVATKMAGYINKIYVEESEFVTKGQRLATIDESDINSNIALLRTTMAQQQNDLALAQQIYRRNQKLYDVGGLAKEQLDTSRVVMQGKSSAITGSKQKIVQLQDQKNYLVIKAPFSGEIDALLMHEGDLAVAGKPILSMSNGDKKLVFSFVPSTKSIKKGQDIYSDGALIGKVSKILTLAKQGLVQGEVALGRTLNLPLGATINIEVLTQQQEGCIVPNNTLLHKIDGDYLMIYKDSKFLASKIETIMSQKNETMISPCPTTSIAVGSEVLLAKLPVYGQIDINQ